MKFEIVPNVYWVGKIDWELRKFHGEEYSTHRGTSYNSYLVKDEKIALIDTVWSPFAGNLSPIWHARSISRPLIM